MTLYSINDISSMVNATSQTVIKHLKKNNIISTMDKQNGSFCLDKQQVERLLFLCYPKVYCQYKTTNGGQEREVSMSQPPIPKSTGYISTVYSGKKAYYYIRSFPIRYTEGGKLEYFKGTSFKDKKSALKFREQLIKQRKSNKLTVTKDNPKRKQKSFYDYCVEFFKRHKVDYSTKTSYMLIVEGRIKPHFKDIPVSKLDRKMLQSFVDKYDTNINYMFVTLSLVLTELFQDDKIPKDFYSQLKKPKRKTLKKEK